MDDDTLRTLLLVRGVKPSAFQFLLRILHTLLAKGGVARREELWNEAADYFGISRRYVCLTQDDRVFSDNMRSGPIRSASLWRTRPGYVGLTSAGAWLACTWDMIDTFRTHERIFFVSLPDDTVKGNIKAYRISSRGNRSLTRANLRERLHRER